MIFFNNNYSLLKYSTQIANYKLKVYKRAIKNLFTMISY